MQHRDTGEENAAGEDMGKRRLRVDGALSSPFVWKTGLAQNEIRKCTLEDGLGRGCEVQ
jgi:hypothetical protein